MQEGELFICRPQMNVEGGILMARGWGGCGFGGNNGTWVVIIVIILLLFFLEEDTDTCL